MNKEMKRIKVSTTVYFDPKDRSDLKNVARELALPESVIIRVAIREACIWYKNLRPKFLEEYSKQREVSKPSHEERTRKAIRKLQNRIQMLKGKL